MPYLHYQYWPVAPTVPARRAASNPLVTTWPVVQGWCEEFLIQIPAGHAGLTGAQIRYQGQTIVPWGGNQWVVGSGDLFTLKWGQEIMASGLQLVTYNTDISPHQFFAYASIYPTVEPASDTVAASAGFGSQDSANLAAISGLTG